MQLAIREIVGNYKLDEILEAKDRISKEIFGALKERENMFCVNFVSAGIRDIPIHSQLRPRLLEARGKPFSPVFPTGRGGRQNENSLRRMWTGFKRELDIYLGAEVYRNQIIRSVVAPDLTPYCLRHTFCTDLQRAGVPLNVAKELMGHSDISTTANIYVHMDVEELIRSVENC